MSVTRKIVFSSVFLFLSLGAFSNNCRAEDQDKVKGFSINPFFQEVSLGKNQNDASFNVEITNNTAYPAVFRLSVLDFGSLDESGGVAFLGDSKNLTNKYALASWVSLEKDALALNPGEKQSVKVKIQNKESLTPGGHYAAIMAKLETTEKNPDSHPSEVALDPSFSSLIFVRKLGGEIYGLNLKDQEIVKRILGLPTSARLRFQNTGNVHLVPRGTVTLNDPLGREVERGIINQESALILPETFRVFPTALGQVAMAFVPGRYQLSITYRYDGQDDFVSEQSSFLLIPPFFALAIVFIIILAIGQAIYRRNPKRWKKS